MRLRTEQAAQDFPPARGDVHLWVTSPHDCADGDLLDRYRELLPGEERAREQRFRFERDRKTYLVTRVLTRIVLSRYRAVEPQDWRFAQDAHGRPYIRNDGITGELTFNISHTDGFVTLAVTEGAALGVDVESVQRNPSVLTLADRFFAAGELSQLRFLPTSEQGNRFYSLWTLKEAYIKARGLGLAIPLNRFNFDLNRPGEIHLAIDSALGDSAADWHFWQFRVSPDHIAAICTARLRTVKRRLVCRSIVPLMREEAFDPTILRASRPREG